MVADNTNRWDTRGADLVVCLDVYRLQLLVELRGGEWGMQERIALIYGATDATMVAQDMTVAAEILGYGTCYVGAVQNSTDRIAKDLNASMQVSEQ